MQTSAIDAEGRGGGRRPRSRRFILAAFALAALVALTLGVLVGLARQDATTPSTDALFAVALPDVNGQPQSIGQWRGKVLVVNFWATWCGPCRQEMPEFIKAQSELGGRGLQFVGIAADEPDRVRRFSKEIGLNYPALIGGFGAVELSKTYGNRLESLPFTMVIDRAGRIVHTQLGPLAPDKLRAIVAKAL